MGTAIATATPHDRGCDLVPGHDVTGPRVGKVYYDGSGPDAGLVIALDGGEEYLTDGGEDARLWLAGRGYDLDEMSVSDIDDLLTRGERANVDARSEEAW